MIPAQDIEHQDRLAELCAIIDAKRRFDPPLKEDIHNWVKGTLDVDHADGTMTNDIPVWFPRLETEEWQWLRFRSKALVAGDSEATL